ncbi:hypothetical protein RJT34_30799 [Clitoria ternatea]|uniref:Uncharacterized protein n=1 Tax=Clitoria ternatea TaxID=43366 RepID=A0AAN9I2B5_CLITE
MGYVHDLANLKSATIRNNPNAKLEAAMPLKNIHCLFKHQTFFDKDPSKQATIAGSEVVIRNLPSELGLAYPDIFLCNVTCALRDSWVVVGVRKDEVPIARDDEDRHIDVDGEPNIAGGVGTDIGVG